MRDWIHLVRVLWNDLDPTADPTTLACSHVPLLLHVHMCLPLACSHVPILIVYTVCATGKSPPPLSIHTEFVLLCMTGTCQNFQIRIHAYSEEMGGGGLYCANTTKGGPERGFWGGGGDCRDLKKRVSRPLAGLYRISIIKVFLSLHTRLIHNKLLYNLTVGMRREQVQLRDCKARPKTNFPASIPSPFSSLSYIQCYWFNLKMLWRKKTIPFP